MHTNSNHRILGVSFDLISYEDVFSAILNWRKNGEQHYITLTPPHSVLMCHRDDALKKATENSSLTLPDGIGIVLAANFLSYEHHGRVTGPMLMLKLCDCGRSKKLRHFFYGSTPDTIAKLTEKLTQSYPGLDIAGSYCPPFSYQSIIENTEIVQHINQTKSDIVWIGLGSPKQEKWMAEHFQKITATAMIGVGAAFDFHSGNIKWAPAWIRKSGLEWAYRLIQEPRRMWPRNVDSFVYFTKILHQRFFGSNGKDVPIFQDKKEEVL